MANIILREKARQIRMKDGASIKEISDLLKVSKSTISFWCKEIILNRKQLVNLAKKQKEAGLKGSLIYSEKIRQERIERDLKQGMIGKRDVGILSKRDLLIAGLALYWAEGYKKSHSEIGFTNSDPKMITLMLKWFREIYGIEKDNFVARLSINILHQKKVSQILKFWSKNTGIPLNHFTKTSLIKSVSKKIYPDNKNYYGVLRIKVRKGTILKQRILGGIEFLKEN
ncbi:MAG: hypothetical protein WCV55_00490 [Candidatus Paceibacterota bacterium]